MGYIRHNAIIVTTLEEWIGPIHEKAVEICGGLVSPLVPGRINGYSSFFVAPDGSKEGWIDSSNGDKQREKLMEYLDSCRAEGKGWPEWVEVAYGSDDSGASIVNHAWESQSEN